jgi:hypothetical protein
MKITIITAARPKAAFGVSYCPWVLEEAVTHKS